MGLILMILFYFAPTFVAYAKSHKHSGTIGILNLIFGWTLVGWIVLFVVAILK